jgi:Holliday junction resolvase RusA-like endonuclease
VSSAQNRTPLVIEVLGRPVPKGAVSAFVVPGKSGKRARAVVVQGGSKARRSKMNEWSSAIQDAALVELGVVEAEAARFAGVPVEVEITFRLGRPKSHYWTGKRADVLRDDAPTHPIGTPDIDKLTRTALDALIGVAFDDDSRVARLTATKIYADAGREGARISVAPVDEVSDGDHLAGCPCAICQEERDRLEDLADVPAPVAKVVTTAQKRIHEIIKGTAFRSESEFLKGHTLERHVGELAASTGAKVREVAVDHTLASPLRICDQAASFDYASVGRGVRVYVDRDGVTRYTRGDDDGDDFGGPDL